MQYGTSATRYRTATESNGLARRDGRRQRWKRWKNAQRARFEPKSKERRVGMVLQLALTFGVCARLFRCGVAKETDRRRDGSLCEDSRNWQTPYSPYAIHYTPMAANFCFDRVLWQFASGGNDDRGSARRPLIDFRNYSSSRAQFNCCSKDQLAFGLKSRLEAVLFFLAHILYSVGISESAFVPSSPWPTLVTNVI